MTRTTLKSPAEIALMDEANRIIRDEIANRTDDEGAPPELNGRTEEILKGRVGWLGSRAS